MLNTLLIASPIFRNRYLWLYIGKTELGIRKQQQGSQPLCLLLCGAIAVVTNLCEFGLARSITY